MNVPADPQVESKAARQKRVRSKNIALLWTLVGLIVLFFAITLVQVGRR